MSNQDGRLTTTSGDPEPHGPGGEQPSLARRSGAPAWMSGYAWPPATGKVIDNPISGEHIVIRESSEQTNGELLSFDLYLPPGGHVPARHVHPIQEERFTIVEGTMRFRLGRGTILAHPGQTVVVPAGKPHWFGNAGRSISHARVEVRPALRMQEMFEETQALGRLGRIRGTHLPPLTALASVLLEFQREVAVPDVPASLVKAVLAPLAWMGRRARTMASAAGK